MSSNVKKSKIMSSPTTRSSTLGSRQTQTVSRKSRTNLNMKNESLSSALHKNRKASSSADKNSYSLRNSKYPASEFELKGSVKVHKIVDKKKPTPKVKQARKEIVYITDQSEESTDGETQKESEERNKSNVENAVPIVFIVSSDEEKSGDDPKKLLNICEGDTVHNLENAPCFELNESNTSNEKMAFKMSRNSIPVKLTNLKVSNQSRIVPTIVFNSENKLESLLTVSGTDESESDTLKDLPSVSATLSPLKNSDDSTDIFKSDKYVLLSDKTGVIEQIPESADDTPHLQLTSDKEESQNNSNQPSTSLNTIRISTESVKLQSSVAGNSDQAVLSSTSMLKSVTPNIDPAFSNKPTPKTSQGNSRKFDLFTVTKVASKEDLSSAKTKHLVTKKDTSETTTEHQQSSSKEVTSNRKTSLSPHVKIFPNLVENLVKKELDREDISQTENYSISVQAPLVDLKKETSIDHQVDSDTTDKPISSFSAEVEVQEPIESKDPNVCSAIPGDSIAEGPGGSSDSRSSNSSCLNPEEDLYSLGSTDFSVSEDSRSSFQDNRDPMEKPCNRPARRSRSKNRLNQSRSGRRIRRPHGIGQLRSRSCSGASEDGSVERSVSQCSGQQFSVVKPGGKPLPTRPGILWEIGQRLEAMDFQSKWSVNAAWYPAKIVEVDAEACEILIHFEGWSARYDEWVLMDSTKLRAPTTPNPRATSEKDKGSVKAPIFKVKEKVLARWNNGKLYEATITQIYPDGAHYGVIFYDGFSKKLPLSAVRKYSKTATDKMAMPPHMSPKKGGHSRKRTFEKVSHNDSVVQDDAPPSAKRSFHPKIELAATARDNSVATAQSLAAASIVASKQFVVETDHNHYKCPFKDCTKGFRKESLLQSHVKHYHDRSPSGDREQLPSASGSVAGEERNSPKLVATAPVEASVSVGYRKNAVKVRSRNASAQQKASPPAVKPTVDTTASLAEDVVPSSSEESQSCSSKTESSPETAREEENALLASQMPTSINSPENGDTKSSNFEPEAATKELIFPPSEVIRPAVKAIKTSPRKGVLPLTKMETRHAKPCLFREDSIYTGYISYRSLYSKGSRGRKTSESDGGKRRRSKGTEDEKEGKGDGEGKKTRRKQDRKGEPGKNVKVEYPDIDDEIAEMKKRRTERFSECSVKTDETTRDSMDIDEDDASDQDDAAEGNQDDEVVRCICHNNEENGLMFQCEECKTWQHAACFNIDNEEDVPETYFCYVCTRRKVAEPTCEKVREPEEDPWLTKGELPSFGFVKKRSSSGRNYRPASVQASHHLMTSVYSALGVLSSLQHKLHIVQSDNHPDLKLLSRRWKRKSATNKRRAPPGTTTITKEQGNACPRKEPSASEDFLIFDHSYFSTSDQAFGIQEEVVIEENSTSSSHSVPEVPLCIESTLIYPASSSLLNPEVKVKEEPCAEDTGSTSAACTDSAAPVTEEEEDSQEETIDLELCKRHLLENIHSVQDDLDSGLDYIESQLNLLEAEMEPGIDHDDGNLETLLVSVKSLGRDLGVVQRFTLLQ